MLSPNLVTTPSFVAPNDPTQLLIVTGPMDQTITIEGGMTDWPIGSVLTIVKRGGAWLTIQAAGAAVVSACPSLRFKLSDIVIPLMNVGPDTWVLASTNAAPAGM